MYADGKPIREAVTTTVASDVVSRHLLGNSDMALCKAKVWGVHRLPEGTSGPTIVNSLIMKSCLTSLFLCICSWMEDLPTIQAMCTLWKQPSISVGKWQETLNDTVMFFPILLAL